jgi:DNA-directed RNA polymerase subunit beta'
MKRYRAVKLFDEENQDLDQQMEEILEQRKLEAAAVAEGEEEDFIPDDTEE